MASIKDLYTRESNNETYKLLIGDDYIEYLGTDSDVFIKAKREAQRAVIKGEIKAEDMEHKLVSAVIVGWSYDEPCTDENKIELLKNSPSLAEAIDRAASERANFIKRASQGSKRTQKNGSGSRSPQPKAQK
jgi:hypothetical protein